MRTILQIVTLCIFSISFTACISAKKSNMEFVNVAEIKNKSAFSAINLPTFMIKPFIIKSLKKEGEDEGTINLVKSIKKARILTIDNPSDKVISDFNYFNETNEIQELLSVNDGDDKVKIYGKEIDGGFNRLILAISSKSDKDLTFIDVKGKFTEQMVFDLNIK